ncbi:hypothetical protein [Crocosphaera chwakensis]|uniref:Uncharacterized protein n=1 Tax=Crocosphaera chwakensis CCY0110 TaxID=391612 RepID=A3IYU2_9CHRO|nr:hypothetical protein [Crocosphaera chwakensis]EAZ88353.1 hypothetical protein CY0110_31075 [Crocosphaera chwakensis CCY0110]
MAKFISFQAQKILDSDYSQITKGLNQLLKEVDNIFSWKLENRPLVAARNINELITAVIEKSVSEPAKLEYRKDEFMLTKFAFIEFSLAEELEFQYWRKRGIRNLTLQKFKRYLLWLLIPKKVESHNLSKLIIWDFLILFLEQYSDFLDFKMNTKINEYETLIINWRYYDENSTKGS